MRSMTVPSVLRHVAIYSVYGRLLGRAPLACLYAWPQASFAIATDGTRHVKPRRGAPDDDYCWPLDDDDAPKGGNS